MRILANENLPREVVEALREDGHDVPWVRTEMPGAADDLVLRRARGDARPILTFDKDFGELAFQAVSTAPCGRGRRFPVRPGAPRAATRPRPYS